MPRAPVRASPKNISAKRGEKRSGGGPCNFPTFLTAICCLMAVYLFAVSSSQRATIEQSQLLVAAQKRNTGNIIENSNQQKTTTTTKVEKSVETTPVMKKPGHEVAGLNCDPWGGPPNDVAAEMVYWKDIPQDAHFQSPFKNVGPKTKYLTFEPDEGGWNNIRMAMETAVTMALAMGRTLVLPPEQGMYLLHQKDKGQKNRFTFKDFFHFDSVETEHPHLTVISFTEFLQREAMTGHLLDAKGKPSFPPRNQTNWDGKFHNYEMGKRGVFPWLRTVTKVLDWNMDKCLASFPKEPGPTGVASLKAAFADAKQIMEKIGAQKRINSYNNNPTPVDAPPEARIREMLATRQNLCIYDESFQQAPVVHAMGDNDSGARMLAHFYSFLFFEDWKHDQWTKRFVRDHLRYVDQIQCAAARWIDFLHMKARQFGEPNGNFYTMHIRRGDFQYKDTRIEADVIFESIRDVIPVNATLYIATDEKDRSFFKIFHKNYRVYFLDSNPPLAEGLNTNFYGMLDQLIASKGHVFAGTYYSTFTGYINRMRGYRSQTDKLTGYQRGEIDSYYYVPMNAKFAVKEYRPPHPPYWAREFPIGWREIDKSLEA
ncbi:GDP-fucose protein O-fucosyltransferase [Seminavis robusta]|uniref:GDP-fucose protein O-fucosyltransferase n=1 Tax=Seminavis robusta TaxID=568900 RepID=A0A9N8HUY8_9STRA|nr:GDP-fucose protein O-fucosyltransferase [Seminavis robusta]|eukprot:Sro1444_g273220.1 GDP-fucose protein O-fucosyltransferase (598) ;mRNA; r:557-2693